MQFWPNTRCPLIFFTDPQLVSIFQEAFQKRSGPTHVIGLPFKHLAAFTKLSSKIWVDTQRIDPEKEKHSPELYAIWYEKKEFVLRAIAANPFRSDHFVWCDAGICRFPEWITELQQFPQRNSIPQDDKMLVLRIAPFLEEDYPPDSDGIRGKFDHRVSVGGGILAATIKGWVTWSRAYDAMLMRYYFANRFIGKDQNIMASMILERPDNVVLVDPPAVMNSIQRWFYLLFFLGNVRVV